jgi:LiaI-LiaF-like transmembrane region
MSGVHDDETAELEATQDDAPGAPGAPADAADDAAAAVHLTSLVGGLCLVALGTLLVLETEDVIDLTLGYLWPALLAAAGATLLASGLRKGRR